ncbi:hypothetical protein B0I35DRAFT_428230 [Stachybotrys elegans]|uniref:Uncharacterized protein n=1 Tax=Stachybotrys elegans TaxID=80388 RepID=A0A8K0SVJ0_9HYPO|nr:hypothetical protein B0I35DRAFT_428230 [Stachybotrys elegans]
MTLKPRRTPAPGQEALGEQPRIVPGMKDLLPPPSARDNSHALGSQSVGPARRPLQRPSSIHHPRCVPIHSPP